MAIIYRGKQNNDEDSGNIFWVTMADLLLGLAIIFITLFVLAMTGFSQQNIQQPVSYTHLTLPTSEWKFPKKLAKD